MPYLEQNPSLVKQIFLIEWQESRDALAQDFTERITQEICVWMLRGSQ